MSKSIPVNPRYDWSKGPADQEHGDFFNPVTLCNKEIFYANSIIAVVDQITAVNTSLGNIKYNIHKFKSRKQEIEETVLVTEEFSRDQTKNVVTQTAYLRERIKSSDYADEYAEVESQLRKFEQDLFKEQARADNGRLTLEGLKLVSQNIQTALSFYKAELKTGFK